MARGKHPTAEQRKLLMRHDKEPKDWMYIGQKVTGDSGSKRLGKDEEKTTFLIFRHRTTSQEIHLCV